MTFLVRWTDPLTGWEADARSKMIEADSPAAAVAAVLPAEEVARLSVLVIEVMPGHAWASHPAPPRELELLR